MFRFIARMVVHRSSAWAVVIFVLLLAALSLRAAVGVRQEDDILTFLPADNPEVRTFYETNKRFGGLDVALVGIEAPDVFDEDFLSRLKGVTRELKDTAGLNHVLSLSNVMDFTNDPVKGGVVSGPLLEELPSSQAAREALRHKVMSRDHIVGNLIAPSGKAVLIYCFLAFGSDPKVMAGHIQTVVKRAFPRSPIYWGGNPFISTYIFQTTQSDIGRLTPWAGIAILAIMMIAFRDLLATVLALASTGIGIVMSLGLMAALGIRFNLVLGSMPVIMLALGSAYAIHVLARYYTLSQDCDIEAAITRTITGIGPTVFAAGLITVVSLLSFVLMDIAPLRIFGLFTALGLAVKLVLSITFIPAVVRLVGLRRRPAASKSLRQAMAALSTVACSHRILVGTGIAILVLGSLVFISRVEVRTDASAFFSPGSPPERAEAFLQRNFGGSQFVQVTARGDMTDPAFLREIQNLADQLVLLPHVSQVMGIPRAVAQVNEAMTGQRRLPDTREQAGLLYAFLTGDPAVAQLITDDRRQAMLQVKLSTNEPPLVDEALARIEALAAAQVSGPLVVTDVNGPRGLEARQRLDVLVMSRIRAAIHAHGLGSGSHEQALRAGLKAASATVMAHGPVKEALLRFLRSEELAVELPRTEGAPDPAPILADELARLGASADEAQIAGALARVLSLPVDDGVVQDLALSIASPLTGIWSQQRAAQRASAMARAAGLTLPGGTAGPRFLDEIAAALLDLETQKVALPARAAEAGHGLALAVTGLPLLNRGLARSVASNQVRSLAFALLFVLLIMSVLFRSPWSGILGMMPALITLLLIWGGMGVLGLNLDMGTSLLGCIIVGAGVDYAVHLLAAWRVAPGEAVPLAAGRAADHAGLAIWTNAVMVATGFFVLTLGEARPLKTVGGLTAAAMITAALATFVAIPALARRKEYRPPSEAECELEPAGVPARQGRDT